VQVAKVTCGQCTLNIYNQSFCTKEGKTFLAKTFLDGKIAFKHNLYANLCNQIHDSTTFNGKKTLDHQQHDILQKALLFGMIFWKTH